MQVWQASLDAGSPQLEKWQALLSADEQARAMSYHFARDRVRFIVRRGILRVLLGRYLGVEAELVRFQYGPMGKPHLAQEFDPAGLYFSLSHSDGTALYGITRQRKIGIDIERIRPGIVEEQIAERFFAPAETAALRALPRSVQPQAFYACWTQKEACAKALGNGVDQALDSFEMLVSSIESAEILKVAGSQQLADQWSLRTLHPGDGFAGAVAVEGSILHLNCHKWRTEEVVPA